MNTTERAYTREQVSAALNAAADLLDEEAGYESSETIRDQDRANLLVGAALHLLDAPGASLDDVILANYPDVDLDPEDTEGKSEAEIGQLRIDTVKEWVS